MGNLNYWIGAVEAGLEDCGAAGKLTSAEIRSVADSVMGAFEVYGEATGRACIPNPLHEEISELQRRRQQDKDEADRRERLYCEHIANRHGGTDSVFVGIQNGRVEIEPRR